MKKKEWLSFKEQFNEVSCALKLTINDTQHAAIFTYLETLERWNQRINLTAIRDRQELLTKHIYDSLVISPYIDEQRILDVGTGAGIPGIPLAILHPEKEWALLDSNGKKTRFLTHIQQTLALQNTQIVNQRVENYHCSTGFDIIMCRAFATVPQVLAWCEHLCAPKGKFLLMKGQFPEEEIKNMPGDFKLEAAHELKVPHLEAERHLLVITRG